MRILESTKKNRVYAGILITLVISGILTSFLFDHIPDSVNYTLKAAGANRKEIQKLIGYYQKANDKKKLEAVYFLLSNMPDMFHYEGKEVDQYKTFFSIIDTLNVEAGYFNKIWDSVLKIYNPEKLRKGDLVADISSLRSDMLIQHIEAAFEAWHYPWARHLTFTEFCEYILPYKIVNENFEPWNKKIQQNYKWLPDSMGASNSPLKACMLINKALHKNFWVNSLFRSSWNFTYNDLNKVFSKIHTRGCAYSVQYSAYVLRAMGIPVTVDHTPYWANSNGGHEWNALILNNKSLPFVGTESDPSKTKVEAAFSRKRAKIYRRTFSMQKNNPYQFTSDPTEIPKSFQNRHLLDVTSNYEPVSNVRIKPDRDIYTSSIVYMGVYNNKDWRPVCWSGVNKKGYSDFKDMGRDIAYLPIYYKNEQSIPAGPPLIIRRSGVVDMLLPDKKNKQTIVVKSKSYDGIKVAKDKEFELFYWDPVDEWTSLGKMKAMHHYLEFNNVPQNALFIVRSDDKPETERIFTYEKGIQKFW